MFEAREAAREEESECLGPMTPADVGIATHGLAAAAAQDKALQRDIEELAHLVVEQLGGASATAGGLSVNRRHRHDKSPNRLPVTAQTVQKHSQAQNSRPQRHLTAAEPTHRNRN